LSNGNIEKLIALLKTDEEGEEIASLLNEFLIGDNEKNAFITRLSVLDIIAEMLKSFLQAKNFTKKGL